MTRANIVPQSTLVVALCLLVLHAAVGESRQTEDKIDLLLSDSTQDEETLATALVLMPSSEVTASLIESLRHNTKLRNPDRRCMLYRLLAKIGNSKLKDWYDQMVTGLGEQNCRDVCIDALKSEPGESIDVLVKRLAAQLLESKTPTDRKREILLKALANLGPEASSAEGEILHLASDTTLHDSVRFQASVALGDIGGVTHLLDLHSAFDPRGKGLNLCAINDLLLRSNLTLGIRDAQSREKVHHQVIALASEEAESPDPEVRKMVIELLPSVFADKSVTTNKAGQLVFNPLLLEIVSRVADGDTNAEVRSRALSLQKHLAEMMDDEVNMKRMADKQERIRNAMLEEMDRLRAERAGSGPTGGKK